MLDAGSALGDATAFERGDIRIAEAPGFELTQIAGEEKDLKKACGKLPGFGSALEQDGRSFFRVSPSQFWVVGQGLQAKDCHVMPLSSGRTRFLVDGAGARNVLARCAALDFSVQAFKPGSVAMTGIHHTPVLIHCVSESSFHVYAMRSFSLSVWEWLCDAAVGVNA